MLNDVFENRVVYKIVWKDAAEPDRSQMEIWCMGIPCGIPKATNMVHGHSMRDT
jgi:hypothetical protein